MDLSQPYSKEVSESKAPLSPERRSRGRILWYLVAFGIMFAAFIFIVIAPTTNKDLAGMRRTEATIQSIVSAGNGFSMQYVYLPVPEKVGSTPDVGFLTNEEQGVEVLRILSGKDEMRNPRNIPFLQMREGKDGKNGLIYSGDGSRIAGLFDAWGNPYQMVFDTDYDEEIVVSIIGKRETVPGKSILVYSAGKDRKLGTADDFQSWK